MSDQAWDEKLPGDVLEIRKVLKLEDVLAHALRIADLAFHQLFAETMVHNAHIRII